MIRLGDLPEVQEIAMPGAWSITVRTVDAPAFEAAQRRAQAAAIMLIAQAETRARYGLADEDVGPLKMLMQAGEMGQESDAAAIRGVAFGAGTHLVACEIAMARAIGWSGVVDEDGEPVSFSMPALIGLLRRTVIVNDRPVWIAEAFLERVSRSVVAEIYEGNV